MKKNRTKRILSMLLTLCMVLSLFPSVASASDTGVTSVSINGQKLDSTYKYLVDSKRSLTGTLGIGGCTAEFDPTSGTLTLKDYVGGEIYADGSGKKDLKVELIGDYNEIHNITGSGQKSGINLKSSSGDLTITAKDSARLKIFVKSLNSQAMGIVVDYGKNGDKGHLTIGGKANVKVNVIGDTPYSSRYNYGVFCDGNITIEGEASFEAEMESLQNSNYMGGWKGIITGTGDLMIDTSGNIKLDSSKYDKYYRMIDCADGTVNINKIGKMTFHGNSLGIKSKTTKLAVTVLQTYDRRGPYTYYRSGVIRDLTIQGGINEYGEAKSRNLVGDTVTITNRNDMVDFGFSKWSGTTGLAFLGSTTEKDNPMKFTMPDEDLVISAILKSKIFVKQPIGNTVAVGKPIKVSWKIASVGLPTMALIERKDGYKWTVVEGLSTSYLAREEHSYIFMSDIVTSPQTYRLHYIGSVSGVDPNHYSDEFTLEWKHAAVKGISVSPLTANVKKGTTQQFTSDVTVVGPYEGGVRWSIEGAKSSGTTIKNVVSTIIDTNEGITTIRNTGVLTVAPDETSKILYVQATSLEDNTKSATSIVNVVKEPVTKYTLSVVNGTGSSKDLEEGSIVAIMPKEIENKVFVGWSTADDVDIQENVAEPGYNFTMPNKNVVVIATYKDIPENQDKLTGTVSISGSARAGATVSAIVSGTNGGDDLYYEWITYNTLIAGIGKKDFFIDDVADFGYPIICQVTSDSKSGSIIGIGGVITKYAGDPVTGVTANDDTDTLTGMTILMEYSIDAGASWEPYIAENPPVFHGNVSVEVRRKDTVTSEAGPATTFAFTDSGLQSIAITKPATKTVYKIGELLDIEGLEVTGTYDGSTKLETITKSMISGFDSSAVAAKQTLTVTVGGKIATYDISIEKSKPSAPAAPVVVSRTETSVTFAKNSNNEFSKDGVWQDSETFSALETGTTYTFTTRVKETSIADASYPSPGTVITLSLPSIIGPVSITGTTTYLETLEADISNLDNVGTSPTYQWIRDGIDISGATEKTYTLVEDDIGKRISVKVLADPLVGFGFVLSGPTMAIEKLDGPAAPEGISSTDETKAGLNDGTLVGTATGQEYNINDASEWIPITGNTVTGLAPESYIVVRVAETPTHKAGAATSPYFIAGVEAPLDGGGGGSSSGGGSSAPISYIITTSAGQGGSIDTAKTVSVIAGASATFNIKANEGYAIEDVKVDGKSIGVVDSYEFKDVNANHTISVTFKQVESIIHDFTDVPKDTWYYESVMNARDKGWFFGTSDTTFSPNAEMTRGMIVTVLWRIEGKPSAKSHSFNDLAVDKYYNAGVAWAAEHGIVSGYGNGMFGPEDSITREQMAVILMNYAKYKGYDISMKADLSKFADGESISPWAKDAISWANAEGLIQGSGSQLMPADNAVRCQVAAILQRFIETIAK